MYLEMKKSELSNTEFFDYTLSSGTKCYIIPRNGFKTSQACIVVDYGSADIAFSSEGNMYLSPSGTAHFIEHRMFEKKEHSFFSEFASSGAYCNAFTDHRRTAYYFSCSNNFYDNLKRLLKMVSEPYFDDEGIKSEREIIKREIAMCNDQANWRVYYNMLKVMYRKKPLKVNIAGTENSLEKITPEILYNCFKSFYTASNMSIICTGDISPKKVAEIAESITFPTNPTAIKYYPSDEKRRAGDFIKERMGVNEPVFSLGFHYRDFTPGLKSTYAFRMAFELIAGTGSALYSKLFMKMMLFEPLGWNLTFSKDFCTGIITGKSRQAILISNMIIDEAERILYKGISDSEFLRLKKMMLGRFLRGFNSIDALCMAQAELSYFKADMWDAEEAIITITKEYVEDILETAFSREDAVLSVVE
ncbi:MAG: insulinase family protein [Clostridia bacterium]|jgi:predicted Zn-dependent peptidase|nr:insulinase family protein [Clostridia bacterium]